MRKKETKVERSWFLTGKKYAPLTSPLNSSFPPVPPDVKRQLERVRSGVRGWGVFETKMAGRVRGFFHFETARITHITLKEKFTPEWPFIFFTPIKSLYKDMLFTKISASNVRYNPTKSFFEVAQNSTTERRHLGADNVCVTSKSSA